jgi:hypothetical protein
MTTGTAADPTAQLIAHLDANLGTDPCWAPTLGRVAAGEVSLHLAVLVDPFLGWLLDGSKTVESRFSRVRCAPYGGLAEGDVIAVKRTGGPVVGAFQAGLVSSFQLTPSRVTDLRERFAAQIHALDDEFWDQRADCAYATLVQVTSVRAVPALPFPKKDRRGWVRLTQPAAHPSLL